MSTEADMLAAALKGSEVSDEQAAQTGDASSLNNETQTPPTEETTGEAPTNSTEEPKGEVKPEEGAKPEETPPSETPTETPPSETPPVEATKSFEEMIQETSEGKFNNWQEVMDAATPKEPEPFKFANPTIENLQKLAESGVEITPELLALQTKDYESMTDPDQILKEQMRMSGNYEGWTEEELNMEIDDKYKRSEWAEEGEDKTQTELLYSKRLLRDANIAKNELLKMQKERTIIIPEDPQAKALAEQQAAEKRQADERAWNGVVDKLKSESTKLTTVIDDKTNESFEYEATAEDVSYATETMRKLGSDPMAIFERYKKEDGTYDNKAIYEMLLKINSMDKMAKIINQNAKAKGAEEEVKGLKNTNFKSDGAPAAKKENGLAKALKDSGF